MPLCASSTLFPSSHVSERNRARRHLSTRFEKFLRNSEDFGASREYRQRCFFDAADETGPEARMVRHCGGPQGHGNGLWLVGSGAAWRGDPGVPPVNHAQDARATFKLHHHRVSPLSIVRTEIKIEFHGPTRTQRRSWSR